MKISTKGRYALRLMLDLASQGEEGWTSLRDISRRQHISVKYLEQIVGLLAKAGFLKSNRGAQGGYRLARLPGEYRVGDILRVTEGNLVPVACLDDEENQCPQCSGCLTLPFWQGLSEAINQYLDGTTLKDLLDQAGKALPEGNRNRVY